MAQVNAPNTQKPDDALSVLMKGLTIASQVYGIRSDMAKLDDYNKKQQDEQDLAKGKYNKNQQISLGEKYDISPTKPVSGQFQEASDANTGSPIYLSLKKDNSPLYETVATMKDGKKGMGIIDKRVLASTGNPNQAMVGFYESAPDNKTREVETVDANGNPIKKIVEDKPGQVFAAQANGDQKFKLLPMEAQEEVKNLSQVASNQVSIANSIDSQLKSMGDSYAKGDRKQAIVAGEQMLKVLNSEQGKDAIGSEEAKRLGGLLKYQILNFTEPGSTFGRDVEGFFQQAALKSNSIKSAIQANRERIQEIYKGNYNSELAQTETEIPGFGSKKSDPGTAYANPKTPSGPSPLDLLKIKAANGDTKAQNYLNSLNGK